MRWIVCFMLEGDDGHYLYCGDPCKRRKGCEVSVSGMDIREPCHKCGRRLVGLEVQRSREWKMADEKAGRTRSMKPKCISIEVKFEDGSRSFTTSSEQADAIWQWFMGAEAMACIHGAKFKGVVFNHEKGTSK